MEILEANGSRYKHDLWRRSVQAGVRGTLRRSPEESEKRLPHEIADDLLELPISTYRLGALNVPCGGGVYFRFLPYKTSRWMFERLNENQEPVVFYLHPWELDPEQPRLPVPRALRLRHYWDLDNTADKLRRLLTDMSFGAVRDVFAS